MKNYNKITGLSARQLEGMFRNGHAMSVHTQRRYAAIILFGFIPRTIKGRLGFSQRTKDAAFLFNSRAIFNAITDDVGNFFTPAFSQLAALGTQCTAFETSINNMKLGILGAEGAKQLAKKTLYITLLAALAYVNGIAYLNQGAAVEIITSAKMQVVKAPSLNKQDFAVQQGTASGSAKLISRAATYNNKRVKAYYQWEYSLDNGTTWIALPGTVVAKTEAADMPTNVKIIFRKRSSTVRGGTSTWSDKVGITLV